MFDHVGIVVTDLERSASLYGLMLAPLGYAVAERHDTAPGEGWVVITANPPVAQGPFLVLAAGRPSFWTPSAEAGRSPVHLCLRAPSAAAVDAFHAAGLEHGARDNGGPGIRRQPFYCAFLIDPDGNNLEAGCYLPHD
jgi:catechol 2,3-dioxygenase-like lactoylglutathione lyase family enzyme